MTSIFSVAKYFLYKASGNDESSITPLKLQKLCYYAQAWHLAWEDQPLFKEEFEAWAHGPANSTLYGNYKRYKWTPIEKVTGFNVAEFTKDELESINAVWDAYGIYDGSYLEKLTHQEDPWKIARGNCPEGASCSNIITKDSMNEYYKKLISG